MVTNKYCCHHMNGAPMTWSYVAGEIKELFRANSVEEAKEEWQDVLYTLWCALYDECGVVLPMVGAKRSIEKFEQRLRAWEAIFNEHHLVFDKKYLAGGSNYEKSEKVEKAIALAEKDQKKTSA